MGMERILLYGHHSILHKPFQVVYQKSYGNLSSKVIFNDLPSPSDPSSVLLQAKNWKGFVTQSSG